MTYVSYPTSVPCQVCKKPIGNIWCTAYTCEECCLMGRCPSRWTCVTYSKILKEDLDKQRTEKDFNPSSRRGFS